MGHVLHYCSYRIIRDDILARHLGLRNVRRDIPRVYARKIRLIDCVLLSKVRLFIVRIVESRHMKAI